MDEEDFNLSAEALDKMLRDLEEEICHCDYCSRKPWSLGLVYPGLTLAQGTLPLFEASARLQSGYVIVTLIVCGFGIQGGIRYLDR